ncbi:MAG TPA: SoxR reducing system RseC family protein [Wenzhouxiangellaceae bacterium]|nr:SoxR reducing system RseC family protein [Wenzhouxiangellaceae bacterium]
MKNTGLIWQIAVVRRDDDGSCWLEFSDPADCSKCSKGTGCGAALFSRLFARPDIRLPVPDETEIPGNRMVRVGLDPRWLMLAAAATYLLPVIAFIVGAVCSDQVWPGSDPAALISGVAFALVTGLLARHPLKFIGRPGLELVELHQGLESEGVSGHFSG